MPERGVTVVLAPVLLLMTYSRFSLARIYRFEFERIGEYCIRISAQIGRPAPVYFSSWPVHMWQHLVLIPPTPMVTFFVARDAAPFSVIRHIRAIRVSTRPLHAYPLTLRHIGDTLQ